MNIINEKVVEYLDGLYKPLSATLQALRNDAEMNHIPIILKDTEELLLNILRIKQPKRILEIGTAIGYSACCFATVCPESEIITIELKEDVKEKAEVNIKNLGFEGRITVVLGDASEVVDKMDIKEKFDFVFIDAGKSHYKEFFDGALKFCSKDAVIVSDNVLLRAKTVSDEYDPHAKFKTNIRKMREYLEYIINLESVNTSVVSVGDGLAISVLGGLNE